MRMHLISLRERPMGPGLDTQGGPEGVNRAKSKGEKKRNMRTLLKRGSRRE